MPQGYHYHGEAIFSKLNGIFGVAIYDDHKKQLILARDPFGVKPLYYYFDENKTLFLHLNLKFSKKSKLQQINDSGLVEYLYFLWPVGPNTIFKNVLQVPQGFYLVLKNGKIRNVNYRQIKPKSKLHYKKLRLNQNIYSEIKLQFEKQ